MPDEIRRVRACAAGVFLLTSGAAYSQTPAAPAAAADTQLETVVVTAQRRNEDIQAVPISIQAFTARDIEEKGVKTSSDIAQFAPNVEIGLPSGAGNQPLINIRGIGLTDTNTNNAGPNGVYLDEVYLSSPASQTFSVFDLQGIEVLKGPQGTLYGRNASGGAINIVTTKPGDDFAVNLHADYGSYNTSSLQGAINGQLAGDLDGRFAFSYNRSDGYMHNLLTGENENGQGQIAARGMLLWKPIDGLKVLFNVHGGQLDNRPTEYRHIGDLDAATGAQCSVAATYAGGCVDLFGYGTPAKFHDGSFNRQQHLRVTNVGSYLRVDYATELFDYTSITAIEYNNKLHPEDSDASPFRLLEINYGVHSTNESQEFRIAQTRARYNWVAGVYYLHENLAQNQPLFFGLDGDSVFDAPGAFDGIAFNAFDNSRQVTDAYAGFGQGEYLITEQLRAIVGARVTQEHKTFDYDGSVQYQEGGEDHFGPITPIIPGGTVHESLGNGNFSWRAGLNYNFTPDIMTYASVATGFKSGDFNGGFLSTIPAQLARQLVPIKPEKVKTYELGVKSSFLERRLIVNAAAFYNDYRDQQVFIQVNDVTDPGSLSYPVLDNAPKSHTKGFDFDASFKPSANFTVAAQAGILRTRFDQYASARSASLIDYTGNQLAMSPHVSGNVSVDYRLPLPVGALDLQGNANYKGHVFFDASNDPYIQQNGYWLENVRLAYQAAGGHFEVAAFVHNLTNKDYYTEKVDLTSPFGFIEGVVGTPRMFGAEFNWRY
jgi:iron complex outermembrane receptor protein